MTSLAVFAFSFLSLTLIGSGVAGKSPGIDLIERQSSTVTGDSYCSYKLCVNATLSGSTVQYELTPKDATSTPGWMAIGLGQSMIGTPMVVLWSNSDGSITLSQRQASGYAEPKVIQNPDRVAALVQASSSASSGNTKFTFTIPSDGKTTQSFIWAWGDENPGSSNIDATIQQHRDKGRASLNLAKDPSATTPSTGSGGNGNSNTDSSEHELPLLPYQKLIVAHAIFCVIGFLLLLPAGTLLARYLRTFTDTWFKGHWIIQFLLAGPAIVVGIAMGIQAVAKAGAQHLDDTHKKWGIAIFVLYLVQCSLGAFIHFVKPSKPGRPPQNYFHAVLGLLIIGSALYQVRTGYADEWPKTTGREEITGANTLWIIWVVLLPILYAAGLAFLPKQYKQEGEKRNRVTRGDFEDEDDIHMMPSNTYKDY